MSAFITQIQGLAKSTKMIGTNVAVVMGLGRIMSTFLDRSLLCLQVLSTKSKKALAHTVTDSITYRPKLSEKGQGAVWVNSVRIDQYYHLPGASPPT